MLVRSITDPFDSNSQPDSDCGLRVLHISHRETADEFENVQELQLHSLSQSLVLSITAPVKKNSGDEESFIFIEGSLAGGVSVSLPDYLDGMKQV